MKMDKVNLPVEEAVEPSEVAQQPLIQECETNPDQCQTTQTKKKQITFADAMDDNETPSQTNSDFKDVLSQPAPELNQRERLVWLQRRRKRGLWAQCDECKSWRFLPDVLDAHELPKKWYCQLNPDPAKANCSVPEAPIPLRDEEDLIHSEYSAGSVVWARMQGYPWWPGIVDDCPDTEQFYWLDGFSDIPTHYNVSFFDSSEVTRAWIAPEHLKPYSAFKKKFKSFLKDKKYKTRLQASIDQANDALNLPLSERLEKYSFLTRYKGDFKTPKKISKKMLENNQSTLKRKFRIEFEMSDSENEFEETPRQKSRVR